MSTLYEISSIIAFIMNKPNNFAQIIGSLHRGAQIDVISISDSWAYFKYNNTDAYVKESNLKIVNNSTIEVKGSITLKYLDVSTNNEIYSSETISNLSLATYSYESKDIYGYKLTSTSPQSVTLTEATPNQTITFYYNKILGAITIKYIDENTNEQIYSSTIIDNLELGSYTYGCIDISGYTLNDDESKTVTLTENNPNVSITFKYNEILGTVTIKYILSETLEELSPTEVISGLHLGTYSYEAKDIDCYDLKSGSTISITLTDSNPTATIAFEYSKIEIPEDLNWNEVPYISTYYIKPVVKPGEEVFIDYYITDYYYKEYMEKYNLKENTWGDDNWTEEVWNDETFTVTVRVEGQEDKLYHNLKAGDHQVSLGIFNTEGEQKFSILCTDKYGRNSHELFNFFLVRKPITWNEYIMTEEDLVTYNIKNTDNYEVKKLIDLSSLTTKNSTTVKSALVEAAANIIPESKTYVCVIADTDGDGTPNNWWAENQVIYASDYNKDEVLQESTNTRIGLQQLLDDKKSQGYNKLRLLPGTYRIDHQLQIYIPTEFTLDMNGAIIKQNQFTGSKSLMIELNNTFDSHVINGTIEGDYFSHDYTNSTNNSEWVNGINIGGEAKYSSFEDLTIKDITGYGSSNGITNSRDGKLGYTYLSPKTIGDVFKLGDIDRTTGLDIESITRTTSDFRDISGYKEISYLSISVYLGYQGNPCGTWNLICHFYDENKNFIKSIDAYQYRRIGVPENSKYMRITILNTSYPTTLSIQYFRIPTHCSFTNINHKNCRCVGMAPNAMNNILINNCTFIQSGQSSAKCALDAKDGWDLMSDCYFNNLSFHDNPYNSFLTCAGHNFIIEGFDSGNIWLYERTRSCVIKNCKNVTINLQGGTRNTIIQHGVYRVYDNEFISGDVSNNLSKNILCSNYLKGVVSNSTISSISSDSNYNNCCFLIKNQFLGYLSNITMYNCDLKPEYGFQDRYKISFNNAHLNNCYFQNCNFYGKSSLANHYYFFGAKFLNCYFEDTNINPNVEANSDDIILFDNCKINYSDSNLIFYSPYSYSKGIFSNVLFNNCTINKITNTDFSFIYFEAKPNGVCSFIKCSITIPENTVLIAAYPSYLEYIQDYTLNLSNCSISPNIVLLGNNLKENSSIKINIS